VLISPLDALMEEYRKQMQNGYAGCACEHGRSNPLYDARDISSPWRNVQNISTHQPLKVETKLAKEKDDVFPNSISKPIKNKRSPA